MNIRVITYLDLIQLETNALSELKRGLLEQGIIGIKNPPGFQELTLDYIKAAKHFSDLDSKIKLQYSPDRDRGETEGYELGAEAFQDNNGNWQVDNQKASYYAFVPDNQKNKWPHEINLKSSYIELGSFIFDIGKKILDILGLNANLGLPHHELIAYGRMLHYQQEHDSTKNRGNWCGAHFDHGIFTGLIPSFYFKDGIEIEEPDLAGLYIKPVMGTDFLKIPANDKSVLFFQVGEFAQLISNDKMHATEHLVKNTLGGVERFSFALFLNGNKNVIINSKSILSNDERYKNNIDSNGNVNYEAWQNASYARYRA